MDQPEWEIGQCDAVGCQARVIWANNIRTGKPAPIDVETSDDGNIRLSGPPDRPFWVLLSPRQVATKTRGSLRKAHHTTCSKARGRRTRARSS